MAALQVSRLPLVSETEHTGKYPWWRSLVLFVLLLLSMTLYILLIEVAPKGGVGSTTLFTEIWIIGILPYLGACALVLATKPASGLWYRVELGLIFVGAFVFRAMLLPLPPIMSGDSWRYLWDARVFLHGYSPYVTVPDSPVLKPLRDQIYWRMGYHEVPTLYPPGAQYIYTLSYLLAAGNLYVLKALFMLFDMTTCILLALFLRCRQLDPRRAIIYAWCPLPIVEFAVQGHVDVVMLTFMMLAVLCATSSRRGSRALTGLWIGLATLTKIYPLLLLVAIVRRRDWALLATCFATIILGYIPFIILGHGQVFGFFSTYASQQGGSAGTVQLLTYTISNNLGYSLADTIRQEYVVDAIFVCSISLIVLLMRLLRDMSMEAAVIVLIGTVLSVSSHILPWYTTAFVPWIAVLVGPLWTRNGPGGKALAVGMAWYFVNASLFQYFYKDGRDWYLYYWFVYDVVMAGLGIALMLGIWGELKHLYRLTLEGKPR